MDQRAPVDGETPGTTPAPPAQPRNGGAGSSIGDAIPSGKYPALRTGWMMAEVRGSLRALLTTEVEAREAIPSLPLEAANERSRGEEAIEAVKVLANVAKAAVLDFDVSTLTGQTPLDTDKEATASDQLRFLAYGLMTARGWDGVDRPLAVTVGDWEPQGDPHWWQDIANLLWAWDASIQDRLAAQQFGTSSCYQLSRGLAEVYWALEPCAERGATSWGHLLGTEQVQALSELLSRLSPTVVPTETAGAIKYTLGKWQKIARDPALRGERRIWVAQILREQVEMWRDLLLMAADPDTFPDVGTIARASRRSRYILGFFSPEILLGGVAASGLGVSIYYLSGVGTGYAAVGAALSALGLTGSAASGTIKSFSQGVTSRVRAAASQDAVIKMITRLPQFGWRTQ